MRNIIITGAGDGVGKTIATMLKTENLILVDIEKDNLEKEWERRMSYGESIF